MRRGMGKGRGKGYRNLIGKDPFIHSASAKGMKQPQRMNIISRYSRSGKDAPTQDISTIIKGLGSKQETTQPVVSKPEPQVTEVRDDMLTKVAEKQEKKPSKVITALSRAGSAAVAFGSKSYKAYQASARQKAREKREAYIDELRDVEHPLVKKRDKIEDNISKIEERIASGVGDEDKQFEELETLKEELKEVEDNLQNIDLSTFTDSQLKGLAVRHQDDDDLFSTGSGNKYERELLRRIEYRKELDKKMHEANKAKKESSDTLFDF